MDSSYKQPYYCREVESTQHNWCISSYCGHPSVSTGQSFLGPLCTELCAGSLSQLLPSKYYPFAHDHFSTSLYYSANWLPHDLCGKSWIKLLGTLVASFSHTTWFIKYASLIARLLYTDTDVYCSHGIVTCVCIPTLPCWRLSGTTVSSCLMVRKALVVLNAFLIASHWQCK